MYQWINGQKSLASWSWYSSIISNNIKGLLNFRKFVNCLKGFLLNSCTQCSNSKAPITWGVYVDNKKTTLIGWKCSQQGSDSHTQLQLFHSLTGYSVRHFLAATSSTLETRGDKNCLSILQPVKSQFWI